MWKNVIGWAIASRILTGWSIAMFLGTKSVKTACRNVNSRIPMIELKLLAIAGGKMCDFSSSSVIYVSPIQPKISDVIVTPTCAVDRYSVRCSIIFSARRTLDVCLSSFNSVGRTLIKEYSNRVNSAAKSRMNIIVKSVMGLVLTSIFCNFPFKISFAIIIANKKVSIQQNRFLLCKKWSIIE